MTKKKRFGISEALTRGLSETINVVENNAGLYRNVILPLSRIELDPDNPRQLALDMIDIKHGLKEDDKDYLQKQNELEKIKELAHTIKENGIINPIVVYKRGELYRIVAGERRCLASILINKQEIEARVFNEKPSAYQLKLVQWVENTAREDLSLHERLENVRELLNEYQKQHPGIAATATVLKNITGLSLSQTTYYLSVLTAPEDVQQAIKSGSIRNLDKAALISHITQLDLRQAAIAACSEGSSLKELRALVNQQKMFPATSHKKFTARAGANTKFHMGSTRYLPVVKTIMECVLTNPLLTKHREVFAKVDWDQAKAVKQAFKKMIALLEVEVERVK